MRTHEVISHEKVGLVFSKTKTFHLI